jgi:tetratricopeptide (TPR) repeat protein
VQHSVKTKLLPSLGILLAALPLAGAFRAEAATPSQGNEPPAAKSEGRGPASHKKDDPVKLANKELAVAKAHAAPPEPQSEEAKLAEVKGFVKSVKRAIGDGQQDLADRFLESIVAIQLPDVQKKVGLREIAELYESGGDKVRAIAIYEKLRILLEDDSEGPQWLLKLGELYRNIGAHQMAVSRFYDVIKMSMKSGGRDFESHQAIGRKAQREIADTYFVKGDFEQAQKFYNMALRSDLSKEDRAIALFRAGHCTFMRSDMPGAVTIFERFLKDYSQHASAAEARYMLASSYRAQGRTQEAYDTVLELLRTAKSKKEADPKIWVFWQKKAGNEFANDFYQRGEFVNAVTIYQSLAALAETPEWRWPVVYQMGLCFERLRLESRAKESYQYILDESENPETKARKLPDSLAGLIEMAKWRSEQLAWEGGTNNSIRTLAGPEIKTGPQTP